MIMAGINMARSETQHLELLFFGHFPSKYFALLSSRLISDPWVRVWVQILLAKNALGGNGPSLGGHQPIR